MKIKFLKILELKRVKLNQFPPKEMGEEGGRVPSFDIFKIYFKKIHNGDKTFKSIL